VTSSSSKGPVRNVPPPPGSKGASAYTRFIPREELQDFAAWAPASFGDEHAAGVPPTAGTAATGRTEAAPDPELEARVAAARQAGYQDGYRDGLSALEGFKQSFAGQMSAQVGQLLQGIDQGFQALEATMAQAVASAAVQLARQVLRTELVTRPEIVARVASEAVGAVLLSARHVTLHLHPKDLPLVAAAEADAEALAARSTRLVADDGLERGGCRVESDLGVIDARIGERWAQAAATLGVDLPWPDVPDDHG
jgi:flagellar assembly protein FliH